MGKEKKSVKRLNVEKSRNSNKFDSVRQIDFRLWVPGFMAKAAASECLKFFEGTEELTFDEQRPCAYGEEDQYVTNQVESQKAVIRKAYKKNVVKISKSSLIPSDERLRMILSLDLEKNKEIARIKNSKDKIAKDLETSIVIFEKKERTFKVNQASAVNLMFESLGPNCLDEIKDLLTEKKPWAAWNKLKERFDSSKGGSANTASILDEIKDYTIEKKNGSITASIHYLKALGQEYDAAGSGKMDANLIFTFLLDAMSRSGLEEFKDLVHDARKPGSNYNLNMFEEHVSIIENRTAYDHTKEKGEKKGTSNSAFQNTLKNLNSAEQLMSLLAKVNHTKKPGKTPASNSANSAVVCSTCNRAGHTSEKCWKNHICTICNKKGHTERYCHLSKENNKSDKKFKVCVSRGDSKNGNTAVSSPESNCVLWIALPSHNGSSASLVIESHDLSASINGEKLLVVLSESSAPAVTRLGSAGERAAHFSLRIIIDSGASSHMFPCPSLLIGSAMRAVQGKVSLGNSDYKLDIVGAGMTPIDILDDVLLVPKLSFGLISISKFDVKGYRTEMKNKKVKIFDERGKLVLTGRLQGSLYYLDEVYMNHLWNGSHCRCKTDFQSEPEAMVVCEHDGEVVEEVFSQGVLRASAAEGMDLEGSAPRKLSQTTAGKKPIQLLHERLGHLGEANILKGLRDGCWVGAKYKYEDVKDDRLPFCPTCMEGRMKSLPPSSSVRRQKFQLFEKMGMDYKGKFSTADVHGNDGFYLVADYGSGNVFAYLCKSKDEDVVLDILEKYKSLTAQAGATLKVFQSDYDPVLLGAAVMKWLRDHNIRQQASVPYLHWQNGFIESNVGKVMDKARTLMASAAVPKKYWSYAVLCACYLLNRSPFGGLKKTLGDPKKTPYEIRFGGSPDISHLVPFYSLGVYHKTDQERHGPWAKKAQRCRMLGYDEKTKNGYIVLDLDKNSILTRYNCVWDEAADLFEEGNSDDEYFETPMEGDVTSDLFEDNSDVQFETANSEEENSDSLENDEFPYWNPTDYAETVNIALLERWVVEIKAHASVAAPVQEVDVQKLPRLPVVHSMEEALEGPDGDLWREAMEKEMKAFTDRNVFGPAEQTGRAMKTKLIPRYVYKNDYTIARKVRMVACGYSQIKGVDYLETYAPTVSTVVILIAIQIGAMFGFQFSQFDVTAAFLEGKNDFKNFARLPKVLGGERVEVIGNFYGEKQGPKIWNDLLNNIFLSFGFERCPVHPCLYLYSDEGGFVYVVVHVDDGLMVFNDAVYKKKFMLHFTKHVQKITEYDIVQRYTGMDFQFIPEENKVKLSHGLYVTSKWSSYGRKFESPMSASVNLRVAKPNPDNDSLLHDTGEFRFICDRARPDMLVATGELSTGGDKNPSDLHLQQSERAKHYLNMTSNIGLTLGGLGRARIFGYSDAAYITDGNCKSRLGGCVFLNEDSGAVRSFSKNDTTPSSLSHSSTEAEIKTMDEWVREVMHVKDIYEFLVGSYDETIVLYVDNLSAIDLCESIKQSHKVKHINLRIHFIREMIESGFLELRFVPTEDNVADVLTKALPVEQFKKLRDILMNGHKGVTLGQWSEEVHFALTASSVLRLYEEDF